MGFRLYYILFQQIPEESHSNKLISLAINFYLFSISLKILAILGLAVPSP
jgi:hypothetical protein